LILWFASISLIKQLFFQKVEQHNKHCYTCFKTFQLFRIFVVDCK
jgi:hypothetical protein